ncbi:MAG: hydroxymethylbilane synthase, partial [Candidatus Eremiobacteraeota bacterium]|nr:hydroxymethylbilane synthase [Candidatus Eremiobacteraeota bacterium]
MYPIVVNMKGRLAVVVGAGAVAERKIAGLLDGGASVRAIAPEATPEVERLARSGALEWRRKRFEPGDLDGAFLAFATTDEDAVNAAVVAAARARTIPVNDAGRAERGDFATPAVHRNGPLTVAVDTGGTSPAVAKLVRDELAATIEKCFANALVCATRGSALAMAQTRIVMAKLARAGVASTVVTITTKGDEIQDRSLQALGTESIFVKELELALRERRADYAVHSCKDLPSTLPQDMELVAIVERADPRDVFCSERWPTLDAVPAGGKIGTSSPRRAAQLRAVRADLAFESIRGNVDTRLRKLASGEYDAIVLAAAGLARLGASARYMVAFEPDVVTPAVAQGALAVEARRGDALAAVLRAALNDPSVELEVCAERAFLRATRGGCQAPIGAHAVCRDGRMIVCAASEAAPGTVVRRTVEGRVATIAEAEALGSALAAELEAARLEAAPLAGRLFLLPRTQDRPSRIAPALREAGAEVIEVYDSGDARGALAERTPHAILFPSSGSVAAIEDYLRELRAGPIRPFVAAMGPASGKAAGAAGWAPDIVAPNAEIGPFVASVTRYVLELENDEV